MIQLNLLPDLKREFIEAQRNRNKVISGAILVSMVVVGIVVAAGAYVYGFQKFQIDNLNNDIKKKSADFKGIQDVDKYLTLQAQLSKLSDLHNGKNVYSRFFDILPKLNPSAPNTAKFSTMQIDDATKTITLTGTTTNFTAFGTLKDTLINADVSYKSSGDDSGAVTKEKLFTGVTVDSQGLGLANDGTPLVSFTLHATYSTNAFLFSSTDVIVTVPNIQNTQYDGQSPVFSGGSK